MHYCTLRDHAIVRQNGTHENGADEEAAAEIVDEHSIDKEKETHS